LKVDDSNEDNILLEDMSVGKKLKKYDCRDVLGGLSYLSFSDVKKESSFADGGLGFDRTYVSELKDSTSYAFKVAKKEEKTYVKCSAEYTGDAQQILESEGEFEDKESKLLAYERTVGFTGKHKGWVYEISEYKAKNLTRKLVELLEEEKEEGEEEEEVDVSASTGGSEDANSVQPE